MESNITHENDAVVKAEVTLPWEKAQSHFDEALKGLRKTVRLPGFRQGRAPTGLLIKRFRTEIGQDIARSVIPEALSELSKEQDFQMVSPPRLIDVSFSLNDSFSFSAAFEIIPKFDLQEWRAIELESVNTNVDDVVVEQELERRCKAAAVDKPVEGRAAKKGDIVKVSLTAIDQAEGETVTDQPDYEISLIGEETHPILREMVTGMEVGGYEEKVHEAAADDPMTAWQGKTVKIFMEVQSIIDRQIPDADDAFAKTQEFDSLDAMKTSVREEIKEHFENHEKQRVIGALLDKLLSQYHFSPPPSLVVEEAKAQVGRQLQPLQQYLQDRPLPKKTMTNLFESAVPQAEQAVRLELILNKIADDLDMEVTDEEVDEVLKEMVEGQTDQTLEEFKAQIENEHGLEEGLAPYRHHLRRRKTIDAIFDAAKITKVDTLTEPSNETPVEPEDSAEETEPETPSGSETEG